LPAGSLRGYAIAQHGRSASALANIRRELRIGAQLHNGSRLHHLFRLECHAARNGVFHPDLPDLPERSLGRFCGSGCGRGHRRGADSRDHLPKSVRTPPVLHFGSAGS